MSEDIPPDPAVAALLAAPNAEAFLRAIEPHARRLVLAIDEDQVDIFDASFLMTAADLVEKGRGKAAKPPASDAGFQSAGLGNNLNNALISFVTSILAAITLEIYKDRPLPPPPPPPPVIVEKSTVVTTALEIALLDIERSNLPVKLKEQIRHALLDDPILRETLARTQITTTRP